MAVSTRTRFEIFKRDSFRCQYCGKSAPDVILHIDHIEPASKGGKEARVITKKETIRVCLFQHPNGETWIDTQKTMCPHFKILSYKDIEVELTGDPGYDPNRSYPAGA